MLKTEEYFGEIMMKFIILSIAVVFLSGCDDGKCRPDENYNERVFTIKPIKKG